MEEDFRSGDAYRFTRSLWGQGVRRAGRCVVAPSHLRRNHGLYYLLKRISVDEIVCSRYLLLRDPELCVHLGAQGAKVTAVCAGDVLRDGRMEARDRRRPLPAAAPGPCRGKRPPFSTWRLIAGVESHRLTCIRGADIMLFHERQDGGRDSRIGQGQQFRSPCAGLPRRGLSRGYQVLIVDSREAGAIAVADSFGIE